MRYSIETESGAHYLINTETKRFKRLPAVTPIVSDRLYGDNESVDYDEIKYGPELGEVMAIMWGGGKKMRLTTPIVRLTVLDDSA